jgi:hypothetical protein
MTITPREKLPVIFRKKYGKVTAVFPTLCWSGPYDMTCYAHVGQHGACDIGWYNTTKAAKPEDYADLLAELKGIYEKALGKNDTVYELVVYRRMTPQMRKAREADYRRTAQF